MVLNIETICEITVNKLERNTFINPYSNEKDGQRFLYDICKDAPNWIGTGAEEYLTSQIMEHTPHKDWEKFLNQTYDEIKGLLGWHLVGDPNYNQWTPSYGLDENPYCHNHKWQYIHIVGESEGRYGIQKHFHFGMNVQGCAYLKSRKGLANLEVGKFYKIRVSKFIDNGRFSKYEYEYEEMTEEDYIWESLLTYWDSYSKAVKK